MRESQKHEKQQIISESQNYENVTEIIKHHKYSCENTKNELSEPENKTKNRRRSENQQKRFRPR